MYRSRPHFSLISSQTSPCLSSFRSTSSQTALLPLSSLVTVAIYSTDCAWLLWYLQRVALLSSASVSLLSNKCCSSVMSLEMLGYFLELQQCIFSLLSAQLHKKFRQWVSRNSIFEAGSYATLLGIKTWYLYFLGNELLTLRDLVPTQLHCPCTQF